MRRHHARYLGSGPSVVLRDPQVGVGAHDDRTGFDQLVERDIVAEPPAITADGEDAPGLAGDADQKLRQETVEFGIGVGAAHQCRREAGRPLMHLALLLDEVVEGLDRILDCDKTLADLEVQNVLFAGDADRGELDRGDQQRRLRPLPLNGFGGHACGFGDLVQRRAGVAVFGEQSAGSRDHA